MIIGPNNRPDPEPPWWVYGILCGVVIIVFLLTLING